MHQNWNSAVKDLDSRVSQIEVELARVGDLVFLLERFAADARSGFIPRALARNAEKLASLGLKMGEVVATTARLAGE